MKKIITLIPILLLIAGTVLAELPAPFEKIKEYAVSSGQKSADVCFIEMECVESGEEVYIGFFHNPQTEITAVIAKIPGRPPIGVIWNGPKNKFEQVYFTPFGLQVKEISQKEAQDIAFTVMREAVRLKLL